METRIKLSWVIFGLVAVSLVYGGKSALRAHKKLVTLDVRNMEVRQVVRKIEWQTWERVILSPDVKGKVTLNIRNAPLEATLDMVAGQVSSRSSHVFPIYLRKSTLGQLKTLLQAHRSGPGEAHAWTNLTSRGQFGPGGGFRGGMDEANTQTNHLLNLSFQDKEPSLAALTLSAASGYQVVPEDGLEFKVSLDIKNATKEQAVREFAHALHRSVDNFYVLQPARFNPGRPPGEVDEEAMRQRMEARMAALSAEERSRLEEMRSLSPEERQARRQARMDDPAVQQRIIDRTINDIRNSTPEQMVQRKRDRQQMRRNGPPQGQDGQPGARPQP